MEIGRNDGRGNYGLAGYDISEDAKNALIQKGVADVGVKNTDADGAFFASAMEQAASTQRFGASVDLKTAEKIAEIVAEGGHAFIAENGSGGVVVTGDGDIEGVFKNRQTGNASTFANLMICAIENGGIKLDCYERGLVNRYERFGFIPVAQVNFDKNQVNERWDFETQGTPKIYFMLYFGNGAVDTIANMDTVHLSTQKELDVLPEMDYDSAYAYRDKLLAERSSKGAPLGGAVERSVTEGDTTAAEAAAKTDSAAAARQKQYRTEIASALRAGDYRQALKLFNEFGNPNLRALNEVRTLKAFGDYAAAMGYDVSPKAPGTDETLAAFEERYQNAIENAAKDGKIKSTEKNAAALNSAADPMADVFGAGEDSHPEKIARFRQLLNEYGVELVERETESLAYCPGLSPGMPGMIYVSKGASYSAWVHEMCHVEDDRAAGWLGMRVFGDPDTRYAWEVHAYGLEIDLALQVGRADIAEKLRENLEQERRKIYVEDNY